MKTIIPPYKWLFALVISFMCMLTLTACGLNILPTEPPPTEATSPEGTEAPSEETTTDEDQILITPTLAPTATPGPVDVAVAELAEATGDRYEDTADEKGHGDDPVGVGRSGVEDARQLGKQRRYESLRDCGHRAREGQCEDHATRSRCGAAWRNGDGLG